LEKYFKLLIKEKYGLGEHNEVPEKLIPPAFSDVNVFLESDSMVILKRHYTNCTIKLRKELLDYLEDLMTQDSVIGFTVSTKSKKNVSNVSKMSTHSMKSVDTKASKALEFYPKHLSHGRDIEGYRRNAKEQYENATNQFEENPKFLNEDLHQMPDHPYTFMNSIKARAVARVAVNDERRLWDGSFDRFEVFWNNVEGRYGQIGAGYLLEPDFQAAYFLKGRQCFIDFLDAVYLPPRLRKTHAHCM
jgi:hypothetical protein